MSTTDVRSGHGLCREHSKVFAWAGRTEEAARLLEGLATAIPGRWPAEVVYNPGWATRMHGIAPCARVMAHAGDKALGMLQLRGEPTARADNMASSLATARFICLPRDSGFLG